MANLAEILKTLELNPDRTVTVDDELRKMIQRRLLETLDDILCVCRENGIHYMMGGGSALGTIRHHGFIPWDDDIDINLERKEYDRFIACFRAKYAEKYWIKVPGETPDYDFMMTQIMAKDCYARELMQVKVPQLGLMVDVFPAENVPDNALLRRAHGVLCMGLRYVLSCIRFRENRRELLEIAGNDPRLKKYLGKRACLAAFFLIVPKRAWVRWANAAVQLCKNEKSKWVTFPSGQHQYFGEMYPRERYCATQPAVFEGREVQQTNYIHEYMTTLFGKYMELPPEDARGKHVFMELDIQALTRYWKRKTEEERD